MDEEFLAIVEEYEDDTQLTEMFYKDAEYLDNAKITFNEGTDVLDKKIIYLSIEISKITRIIDETCKQIADLQVTLSNAKHLRELFEDHLAAHIQSKIKEIKPKEDENEDLGTTP